MTTYLTEDDIARVTAQNGRACGECSLCCWLMDVPALDKPKQTWCQHCRPGEGGCGIYATRPEICRRFVCMWLVNASLPDYWKPSACNMVVDMHAGDDGVTVRVHTHPDDPHRWQQEPYISDLKKLARRYRTVVMAHGEFHEGDE